MDNRPYIEATMEDARCRLEKAGVAAYVIDAFTAETFEEAGRVYPFYDVPDLPDMRLERLGILIAVAKRYLEHYGSGSPLEQFLADEWRARERELVTRAVVADERQEARKDLGRAAGKRKKGHRGPLKKCIERFLAGEDESSPYSFKGLLEKMREEAERNQAAEDMPVAPGAFQVLGVDDEKGTVTYRLVDGEDETKPFRRVEKSLSEIRRE